MAPGSKWLRSWRGVADRLLAHRWRWAALAATVAVAAIAGWYVVLDKSIGTYTATRSDLVQSVVASGRVITPQRGSVASEITSRVVAVPVAEGVLVRQGQVLIELDQVDEQAALAQARAALAQGDAKVRQISALMLPTAEQSLRQATATLTQARRAHDRTSDLVAKNFVSQAQLDDAQRALDVAESQVRAAELQVASYRPGGSESVVAETAREEAQAAFRVAEAKLAATVIRAPVDGVLIGRSVEPGDVAQAGKELMVLAPTGETQIVVDVDEKNLGKLSLGQNALASADAYPAQSFAAELVYVNPGIDPIRGSVEVKLRVPDPPGYLRQDMSVSVDIEVGRRRDVVVIPANAVRESGSPHPWVLAVHGGRAVKQPVKIGMRGDAAVEVLDGVAPGDALVPATNGAVMPGQHLRSFALQAPAR